MLNGVERGFGKLCFIPASTRESCCTALGETIKLLGHEYVPSVLYQGMNLLKWVVLNISSYACWNCALSLHKI